MNQQNNFENIPFEDNNIEAKENPETLDLNEVNSADEVAAEDFVIDDSKENAPKEKPEKRKKKKSKIKKILLWILIVLLVLILSGVVTLFVLIQKGKSSLLNIDGMNLNPGSVISNREVEDEGRTIEYNGKKYAYNEDMTAILCIGVDKESISDDIGQYGTNGQADALFLFAMDTSNGKSTVIPISRDTMVDVDVYSGEGKYVSSSKKQLCLAYSYGDGKEKSCQNTVKSVSRLFYGLPINSYVAIDMNAIEVLSEKIGGVPVTPTEDFSYNGFSYYKNQEVVLKGKKAKVYVQGRDQTVLDSNQSRMARQKQFVSAFFGKAFAKTKEIITFPVDVYNTTKKYMVTDIDVAEVSFLASCVVLNNLGLQYKSIDGEVVAGEKHAEYYAKDETIYDIVVDVFYKPVS